MENPTNKTILLCSALFFTVACSHDYSNGHITTMDELKEYSLEEKQDRIVDEIPNGDDVLQYRDGTPLNDIKGSMDTIPLPSPILEAIERDSLLHKAMILEKILRKEDGKSVYEVGFFPVDGKEVIVVFDAQGNRITSH